MHHILLAISNDGTPEKVNFSVGTREDNVASATAH
jgi:hypothetical protein